MRQYNGLRPSAGPTAPTLPSSRSPQLEISSARARLSRAASDIYCAIAIFTATVLASAAGIGGGAVLVPLYTLLGEFTEHEAIPLSIATVFGASAFSTLGPSQLLPCPALP